MRNPAPDTPSRKRLAEWLAKPRNGRRANLQIALAAATGIPQQTISAYALGLTRPPPVRASLLEAATGGFVRASGWLTEQERRDLAAAMKRAARARKVA